MDKYSSSGKINKSNEPNKIYIVLIDSAPMASLDALLISLERFKSLLCSDNGLGPFETSIRSIQPNLTAVHVFIDSVYANKNPTQAITMAGRTLIIEINLSKNQFLNCLHDYDIDEILNNITAVGSMPTRKVMNQTREYITFPISYIKGSYVKF